jgi:predicted RNA-binding protein YlxR (DUF448 family)
MRAKRKRQKHNPQRTCVVCRTKTDKRRLTRVVATPEQGIIVDPTGKLNGRGAYLCDRVPCWEKAIKGTSLDQALRLPLSKADKEALAAYQPVPGEN